MKLKIQNDLDRMHIYVDINEMVCDNPSDYRFQALCTSYFLGAYVIEDYEIIESKQERSDGNDHSEYSGFHQEKAIDSNVNASNLKLQKDSISFFGMYLGENISSFHCDELTRKAVDIDETVWYDTAIYCEGYFVYVRDNFIVGFSVEDYKLSKELIESLGFSQEELDSIRARSFQKGKESSVYFLAVYRGTQQLDEGLDFHFFENNKVLVGYSEKI